MGSIIAMSTICGDYSSLCPTTSPFPHYPIIIPIRKGEFKGGKPTTLISTK